MTTTIKKWNKAYALGSSAYSFACAWSFLAFHHEVLDVKCVMILLVKNQCCVLALFCVVSVIAES